MLLWVMAAGLDTVLLKAQNLKLVLMCHLSQKFWEPKRIDCGVKNAE
jgi:hypothetical protein